MKKRSPTLALAHDAYCLSEDVCMNSKPLEKTNDRRPGSLKEKETGNVKLVGWKTYLQSMHANSPFVKVPPTMVHSITLDFDIMPPISTCGRNQERHTVSTSWSLWSRRWRFLAWITELLSSQQTSGETAFIFFPQRSNWTTWHVTSWEYCSHWCSSGL